MSDISDIIKNMKAWSIPEVPQDIPHGDMPGDKVEIGPEHIEKARVIFRELIKIVPQMTEQSESNRVVITVCGGSGVGKSEIASLLSFYFNQMGLGSYTLSGDNYPRRIPKYNDAERLRVFRLAGIKALVKEDLLDQDVHKVIHELQEKEEDANKEYIEKYPWFQVYLKGAIEGLRGYLGTNNEIDFDELSEIIREFKEGASNIWLKRMGRTESDLWYEKVDFTKIHVLVIEWTHGNSDNYAGVDIPILLNSTPEETLAHRRSRNRDGKTDSPFTMRVLEIEQEMLMNQAHKAKLIISKSGELLGIESIRSADNAPMLNAYPDSMGGVLCDIVSILKKPEFRNAFQSFYILPSIFNTDLDRGFSVISYDLNEQLARSSDLEELRKLGLDLKLDFILNHASVLSEQFQDILAKGEQSEYRDFFIDWNKFWEGYGEMTPEGYIQPKEEMIKNMFFRKPGLPILMVRFPDGKNVPYWNTFYNEMKYPVPDAQDIIRLLQIQYYAADEIADIINKEIEKGKRPAEIPFGKYESYKETVVEYMESNKKYLGQMDLNIKSPMVWSFYDNVLEKLSQYGASIIRLDAFAYAPKEPGEKNFLNEPGTWEVLEKVHKLAGKYQLSLLPEIHASYSEKNYEAISSKGYMTYDFFLPGLIIDALESTDGSMLKSWAEELVEKNIRTVNMLGCHDGIPLLDLKGLIPEERIRRLIDTVVSRGGMVKDLHGQKNVYYQVNSTYYSALGENDKKLLLARALQLFMPGKPQIWYLDLFAGKNDYEAVSRMGAAGHKEINRTNLSMEQIEAALEKDVVKKQLEMLRFRTTFQAFSFDSKIIVSTEGSTMRFIWKNGEYTAELTADLADQSYKILGRKSGESIVELDGNN